MLVPLKDGTSRNHYPRRYASFVEPIDRSYCRGSGFQLARWKVRQRLRHHGGSVWEVVEDRGGVWGDYLIRCVTGTRSMNDPEKWLEEPGKEMVTHGEYMHRHGWTPLPRDLMADLEESLKAVARG